VNKTERYRQTLRRLESWDAFLLAESGLPGRRANIELARAVAEEGDAAVFWRYLAFDAQAAPTNSPPEFLAFCGVLGLGRLLAEGQGKVLAALRRSATDPRWRVREAVAMALQRWGAADKEALLAEMECWSRGTPLEQRAAAAALCEPSLLGEGGVVERVLAILDAITASVLDVEDRQSEAFRALRKGLGYCWSVAVAAQPTAGKPSLERWLASDDPDVRWIVRQNLRKKRLVRMDAAWVARCMDELQAR
jgi:hypothetical protein